MEQASEYFRVWCLTGLFFLILFSLRCEIHSMRQGRIVARGTKDDILPQLKRLAGREY